MFKRVHHQLIEKALKAFDAQLLQGAQCFFAGGTAIALSLDEYRQSVDIDFLCASNEGWRQLRNAVGSDLGALVKTPLALAREVRTDQNKISAVLDVDGTRIKLELVREGRVSLEGEISPALPVPALSRQDLYAQKLLANDDRGLDRSVMSRDIIDLAMMIRGWGPIPEAAWSKAFDAYGARLPRAFHQSVGMISERAYLLKCMKAMDMDLALADLIVCTLHTAAANLPRTTLEEAEFKRRFEALKTRTQIDGAEQVVAYSLSAALEHSDATSPVEWGCIEFEAAMEAICDHGHLPEDVSQALAAHSPGAASVERQKTIPVWIDGALPTMREMWLERAVTGTDSSPPRP